MNKTPAAGELCPDPCSGSSGWIGGAVSVTYACTGATSGVTTFAAVIVRG